MKTIFEDVYENLPNGLKQEYLYVMTNLKDMLQQSINTTLKDNYYHPHRQKMCVDTLQKCEKDLVFFQTKLDKKANH